MRLSAANRAALWPEASAELLRRASWPIVESIRTGWLYRQSFRGIVPDRILFHPDDIRTRSLEEADAYFRGRFRFAGEIVEMREGSIFDRELPSAAFAAALHGFEWLRHLEAAGGDVARNFALGLTSQWLRRYAGVQYPSWNPEIIAERLLNVLSHGRFFLANSDLVWRSKFFVSLRDQTRMLARTIAEAPPGLARLKSAAALTVAGLSLSDGRAVDTGVKALSREIAAQLLPDGGHITRSPEQLLDAYGVLLTVRQTLEYFRHDALALTRVLERIAPMLRFFRLGDGALGVFHGGGEGDARVLAAALERDESQTRPFAHAPYSGYQRIAAGRTLAVMDVGCAPPGAFAAGAHASALAFEMSTMTHRLIVNCGPPSAADAQWGAALRSTAAHSALTLADTSSAAVLDGRMARLLGPRMIEGPAAVDTRRSEGPQGITVEAEHDGYAERFGVIHWRRLGLSTRGTALTGADRLLPSRALNVGRGGIPFAIRFHIHPDVRVSVAQGGSVILKLPNGEGWRFRCGGALSVEESLYCGGGMPRRAEQVVINGVFRGEPLECAWLLEHIGSA